MIKARSFMSKFDIFAPNATKLIADDFIHENKISGPDSNQNCEMKMVVDEAFITP